MCAWQVDIYLYACHKHGLHANPSRPLLWWHIFLSQGMMTYLWQLVVACSRPSKSLGVMSIIAKCSLWWMPDCTYITQRLIWTTWKMTEVKAPPNHDEVPPHLPCILQSGCLLLAVPKPIPVHFQPQSGEIIMESPMSSLCWVDVSSLSLRWVIWCWQDLLRACSCW